MGNTSKQIRKVSTTSVVNLITDYRSLMTVAFCLVLVGLGSYTQLPENVSESLDDVRYLLILKSTKIKRGDIVSIRGHSPQYVGEHIFTKRVIGLPGDWIIQNETHLTLKAQNGAFAITLPLLMQTKEGQPLQPYLLMLFLKGISLSQEIISAVLIRAMRSLGLYL